MKIITLGLYHLGLTFSACLAEIGNKIILTDEDDQIVEDAESGKLTIFEPGIAEIFDKYKAKKHIIFKRIDQFKGLQNNVLWILIDTPIDKNNNVNLDNYLLRLSKIIPKIKPKNLIISSQLPIGTIRKIKSNFKFIQNVFYIPENLRVGTAIESFFNDNRVVAGTFDGKRNSTICKIFSNLHKPIKWMSWESAELSKHAINAWLANSIVFINELSNIAEKFGCNINDVSDALQSERRIGYESYLKAGPAYSGGTLARDIQFLSQIKYPKSTEINYWSNIQVLNEDRKLWPILKLKSKFINYKNLKILVSGLTYKNNTNTLRGSEALQFYNWAKKECGSCISWEKEYFGDLVDDDLENIEIYNDFYQAIRKSDVLVVYRLPDKNIDFKFISENLRLKTIIDCSNKITSKNLFNLDLIQIGK